MGTINGKRVDAVCVCDNSQYRRTAAGWHVFNEQRGWALVPVTGRALNYALTHGAVREVSS